MSKEFVDRVAWVVGASGALGEAVAIDLASKGARVVLSGRKVDVLAGIAEKIGPLALVLPVDVSSTESVNAAFAELLARAGRIDYLVNTTAIPGYGDFLSLDDEVWRSVLESKLLGYVRTIRAALPSLIAQGSGAIVNVSGRGGKQPRAVHLPGCSANAAVNLLTKGLADQYGPQGIRVNAVAPGVIESPRAKAIQKVDERGRPTNHVGKPEDIANAVTFLLSSLSSNINGTVLAVDGGSLATV